MSATVSAAPASLGAPVQLHGRSFYQITNYDQLPPFFMTLVGASDLWMFISSTGGLTAGRGDADRALFPYTTDDRITESAGHTGGFTALRVGGPNSDIVWQPFVPTRPGDLPVHRTLSKDDLGTTLIFEEHRPDLDLTFRITWQSSNRFGIVRACEITSTQGLHTVEILDGVLNILAAGVTVQTWRELSVLLDAYKRAELDADSGLGIFYLNSSLTDRAEPSESLQATVAWHEGLSHPTRVISARQIDDFLAGHRIQPEEEVRGARGAYLVNSQVEVSPEQPARWRTVMDTPLNAADVVALRATLTDPRVNIAETLTADIESTRTGLEAYVSSSDGSQTTGEELAAAHHGANVLFNIMRGGIPADAVRVRTQDVREFVQLRSHSTVTRMRTALDSLGEETTVPELIATAEATGDADFIRIAREYLPLTFSRRHGDPSRPWNAFSIAAVDDQGQAKIDYQGNWRDILQNWEALAWSFPDLLDSMIQVLLDATTVDGYNPYRLSRSGIDWEVPDPDSPWANIGYWSDHQIIYLLRLLETSEQFHPGRLAGLLNRPIFTHADVPYRIADYHQILQDPVNTISFDLDAQAEVERRVAAEGADGRLLHTRSGDLVRVTLAEKLLGLLAAKLVNLVPHAGIWMNTQRPEWNDANNALVGRGLSVVTLAQLRRYVVFVRDLLAQDVTVSAELADLLATLLQVLSTHADKVPTGFDDASRRVVIDQLGQAGASFRSRVYAGVSGQERTVTGADIGALLDVALAYVDAGLRHNRRADGLYHSYNLLALGEGTASIDRLQEMLEGQVNILGSGLLDPAESLELLTALRSSKLYRADQHSYILYPNRDLPRFLDRNQVPQNSVTDLMETLVSSGDQSIVLQDIHGQFRFAPDIHNARSVKQALAELPEDLAGSAEQQAGLVQAFEEVFKHAEFTGRSGSFFAYEGLGSIYWHMVAKLLLAVQETVERAVVSGADAALIDNLRTAYEDVRHGLGYCKSPEVYGAFPIDPYSHTPADKGASQPGMTGQVKEEVLTRIGELGLRVFDGVIHFRPFLLRSTEWTTEPAQLRYWDDHGVSQAIDLPSGSLGFTFCGVPVVYRRGAGAADGIGQVNASKVQVEFADGTSVFGSDSIPAEVSAQIFARSPQVRQIVVDLS